MNWTELYEAVLKFGGWLVQPEQTIPPVPQHPDWGVTTYEEEKWADEWVRQFFAKPVLSPPPTPRQRYVLIPRFRHASIEISIWAESLPTERVPDPKSKWEELFVQQWHAKGRDWWLTEPRVQGDDEGSFQG